MRCFLASALLALLVVAGFAPAPFFVSVAYALDAGETATEQLTLVASGRSQVLDVEVARDAASRERGLMNRRYLPQNRGMLFDFGREQTVLMWMKNTYIPLDMIFISRDGKVTHVEADTEPLSEAIISSRGPAFAVLEVNAGVAAKIGLQAGDLVKHSMFGR
jgi:uncharacterized membrane protein (UPF0127 family)